MSEERDRAKDYYEKGIEATNQTIRRFLRERRDAIVHGGRATNAFLPPYLDKPTQDWDIFVPDDAETVAMMIEQLLDERYEGNFFEVKAAKHPGTFKVVSRVTSEAVADITVPKQRVPFKRLANGINYATLDYHVQHIKSTLEDPEAKYRHAKDRETLQRIEIHEETQEQFGVNIDEV